MAYYATYMPDELGELQKVVINAGVGFVLPYYGETAPPGTLACDGSEISRAVYDELFAVLGTKAGAGNGSTTFNLPDLRGQFVRGVGGNAAALGAEQSDAIRNFTGTFGVAARETTGFGWWPVRSVGGICTPLQTRGGTNVGDFTSTANNIEVGIEIDASLQVPTAAENRPVNVALLWCIIYE